MVDKGGVRDDSFDFSDVHLKREKDEIEMRRRCKREMY